MSRTQSPIFLVGVLVGYWLLFFGYVSWTNPRAGAAGRLDLANRLWVATLVALMCFGGYCLVVGQHRYK